MKNWKKYIIFINGIYDIACAVCILLGINFILADLHLSMYNDDKFCIEFKRHLAYWIFTYGIIRCSVIMSDCFYQLAIISYVIEALFIINEIYNRKMNLYKTVFVIICCLILVII